MKYSQYCRPLLDQLEGLIVAYKILETCVNCGACVENIYCPGWAIVKADEPDATTPQD